MNITLLYIKKETKYNSILYFYTNSAINVLFIKTKSI